MTHAMMKKIIIISGLFISLITHSVSAQDWALYAVDADEFHNGISKIRNPDWDNSDYGYVDATGKLIIPYKFKRADDFIGTSAVVQTQDNLKGLINTKGEFIFGPGNYYFTSIDEVPGAYEVTDNETKLKGLIKNNRVVIDIAFENLNETYPFINYYNDRDNKHYYNLLSEEIFDGGTINEKGPYVIYSNNEPPTYLVYDQSGEPVNYKSLMTSSQGVEIFRNDDDPLHYGLRDKQSGDIIVEPAYFSNEPIIWINDIFYGYNSKTNRFNLLNSKGETILDQDNLAVSFMPQLIRAWDYTGDPSNSIYFDYKGNQIKEIENLTVYTVDNDDYLFSIHEKNQIFDLKSRKKMDNAQYASRVKDGMLSYSNPNNNKKYFYNTMTGKIIGPYDYTNDFNEGAAIVKKNNKEILINRDGKEYQLPSNLSILGNKVSEGVFKVIDENSRVRGFLYNPYAEKKIVYNQKEGQMNDLTYSNLLDEAYELYNAKKYSQAMNKFYQLMMLKPADVSNFNNYAVCLYLLGKYDEALAATEVALNYWPENEYATDLKGKILNTLNEVEKRKEYEESVAESSSSSIWDALGLFANALATTFGGSAPDSYYIPSSQYNTSISSGTGSGGNYASQYRLWEQRAESNYNSLTNLGSSHTSKSGKTTGSAGGKLNGPTYIGMKRNLREAQKEMRNIRQKAAKAGVNIPQSRWETATVGY